MRLVAVVPAIPRPNQSEAELKKDEREEYRLLLWTLMTHFGRTLGTGRILGGVAGRGGRVFCDFL